MRILTLLLLCISWWGKNQVDAAGALRQVSSGGVVYAAAPQERGAYAVGGTNGQSHYGYNTGTGIAKVEVRQPNGSVVGSYRYFDPNGKQVVRSYIADGGGFRVLGNDLPISPDTPASQVLGAPALTGAFEGTTDFDIPPPLFSGSQQGVLNEPQHSVIQSNALQQHQQAYQRQLQQLENQRQELRVQQEKLEALQREVEAQQQKIQQQYQPGQTQPRSQQYTSSQDLTSSLSEHHPYYQRSNTLTGGLTSPYYYFDQHLNYDFPAGFAYPGLPVAKSLPAPKPQSVRKGCYPGSKEPGCGHNYIIGRARK